MALAEAIDAQIKVFYFTATDFPIIEGLRLKLQAELGKLIGL